MIIPTENGFMVISRKLHRNLGIYKSLRAARRRLLQIEYFKHKK